MQIFDTMKRLVSTVYPGKIPNGTHITTDNVMREKRRVSRVTAKYKLRSEFNEFELESVTKHPKSGALRYNLIIADSGTRLSVSKTVFNELFNKR